MGSTNKTTNEANKIMDFRITMTGRTPGLLMHNGRLADAMDEATKALSALTVLAKTDDTLLQIAKAEWNGSLYWDADIGPYIPGENVHSCLVAAAKRIKKGATVIRSLFVTSGVNPISYGGPREKDALWADKRFVHRKPARIGRARVMRTRPIFPKWSTTVDGFVDEEAMNKETLDQILGIASTQIGVGDWRPMYGRFDYGIEWR